MSGFISKPGNIYMIKAEDGIESGIVGFAHSEEDITINLMIF